MSSDLHAKLEDIGEALPEVAAPAANYVPYILENGFLSISGQLPFINGEKMFIGRLGQTMDVEEGARAARACALNILAQLHNAVDGDMKRVKRCIKLGGFVNATPEFTDHPAVINGASNLIGEVLGDAGKHSRFAVGAVSLPFGVAVEIDALFAVE